METYVIQKPSRLRVAGLAGGLWLLYGVVVFIFMGMLGGLMAGLMGAFDGPGGDWIASPLIALCSVLSYGVHYVVHHWYLGRRGAFRIVHTDHVLAPGDHVAAQDFAAHTFGNSLSFYLHVLVRSILYSFLLVVPLTILFAIAFGVLVAKGDGDPAVAPMMVLFGVVSILGIPAAFIAIVRPYLDMLKNTFGDKQFVYVKPV